MDKLFDTLRDAARDGAVLARKCIKVGRATFEIVVRVILDRTN